MEITKEQAEEIHKKTSQQFKTVDATGWQPIKPKHRIGDSYKKVVIFTDGTSHYKLRVQKDVDYVYDYTLEFITEIEISYRLNCPQVYAVEKTVKSKDWKKK